MPRSGGFNRTIKLGIGIVDILIYYFSFIVSFNLRYDIILFSNWDAFTSAIPFIAVVFVFINILFGIYVLYDKRVIDIFSLTLIGQVLMSVLIMAMTFLGRWFAFPRLIILMSFAISVLGLTLWRLIVLHLYWRKSPLSRINIVGSPEDCRETLFNLEMNNNRQYKVTGITTDHFYENIVSNVNDFEVFYLQNSIPHEELSRITSFLTFSDKRIFLPANFSNIFMTRNRIMNIDDESIIAVTKFEISPETDAIKRIFDIVISLAMLIVTAPITILTGLLIKINDGGPALYKQTRITKGSEEFDVLKFRSMRVDAEKMSGPVLASDDDPRVTKIGKFIRSTRIDELPQLINVLKGDMSLVGPRPERPFFVDQFVEETPYYALRHNVRAGITGYAQVYGKYSTDFAHKLRFDLVYIKNYSFLLDLQILLQTIKIVFNKVSSRGVDEELSAETMKIPEHIRVFK